MSIRKLWMKVGNPHLLEEMFLRGGLAVCLLGSAMLPILLGQQAPPNLRPSVEQPKSSTGQSKAPSKPRTGPTLLLRANEACTVFVDGDEVARLQAEGTKRVPVGLGQHVVEAVHEETGVRWEQEVPVKTRAQVLVRITLAEDVAKAREARLEEEKQKQAEAQRREEELRLARAQEEALRLRQAIRLREDFSQGLTEWEAPAGWEILKEKDTPALKIQGMGFLKKGENWQDYKIEFEIKVDKESAGWMVRSRNPNNFYLFKLSSDQAKAVPKNSLVKYIFSDGKYLKSLTREDAPGSAGVTLLPFKIKNKEYYKVAVVVKGNSITHSVNGVEVDSWTDDTFDRGRFGFNASKIELATIRSVSTEPVD